MPRGPLDRRPTVPAASTPHAIDGASSRLAGEVMCTMHGEAGNEIPLLLGGGHSRAGRWPLEHLAVHVGEPRRTKVHIGVGSCRKDGAGNGSDQTRRCALQRGADRVQLDDRQAARGHRAVRDARRRARCVAARREPGLRRRGACRRALRRGGVPQRRWPRHRRATDEGHPGRRRRASGTRRVPASRGASSTGRRRSTASPRRVDVCRRPVSPV